MNRQSSRSHAVCRIFVEVHHSASEAQQQQQQSHARDRAAAPPAGAQASEEGASAFARKLAVDGFDDDAQKI